jgi:hypothetical protein
MSHDWKNGPSLQWGAMGLSPSAAQTPFKCAKCGASFIHFYNQTPNIYAAMEQAGINPDVCDAAG